MLELDAYSCAGEEKVALPVVSALSNKMMRTNDGRQLKNVLYVITSRIIASCKPRSLHVDGVEVDQVGRLTSAGLKDVRGPSAGMGALQCFSEGQVCLTRCCQCCLEAFFGWRLGSDGVPEKATRPALGTVPAQKLDDE